MAARAPVVTESLSAEQEGCNRDFHEFARGAGQMRLPCS